MNYAERLGHVTVIGAAGKMGSGITLLTAMEMARLGLMEENRSRTFVLNAVDVSDEALAGLMAYIRTQAVKAAEKRTVALRQLYRHRAELVENEEVINEFVFDVLKVIRPTTSLSTARNSTLLFEAVNEDIELKTALLSRILRDNATEPWIFTNTSSIPIHELDRRVGLGGRIVGFHFYNPPAVQRLVELISGESTLKEVSAFATEYATNLGKKVVPSNDVAGFIGNGHFMRDALHGISEVERLSETFSFVESVYMINRVSQDYLVRPMGIFQLIDYVGLDVCQCIMKVMDERLPDERIHSDLLDRMIGSGVRGGQYADGSQKDGFLSYQKGRPAGIYNPEHGDYTAIADIRERCDGQLGALPPSAQPWKTVIGHPSREDVLGRYFTDLNASGTIGADLARRYGRRSKEIARKLVSDGVAHSEKDANTVLLTGFFHAYGPINEYFS